MRDLAGRDGDTVLLCGWAATGGMRDSTGQVALAGLEDVVPGSAVEVTAVVTGSRIDVTEVRVLGPAVEPPALADDAPLDARLDLRHLDLRRPRNRLIFEVQTTVERAMRAWWAEHGFIELHSPKFRPTPNMSGRELFTVDYFGRPAYLAQSPQFYKQMAMCAGLERVFEIGPVFRANPLLTSRHDTEFVSVDVELSWIDSHADVMALEERWLRSVVEVVAGEHGDDIERLFGRTVVVPDLPFPRVTLAEAQEMVGPGVAGDTGPEGGATDTGTEGGATDLNAEGERQLSAQVAGAHGHELVFVTEYPAAVRPFYHMRLEEGSALTRSFDLLWNGLEVTTGAQREHRHDRLSAQAAAHPARVPVVQQYLDFFRHGCPPHGGFGLGLTRVLTCLLGLDDVREATFLPRDRRRLTP